MICKFGLSCSAVLVSVFLFAGISYGQQPYQQPQPQYGASQQGHPQQGYAQPATRPPAVRPMAPINQPAPQRAPFQLTPEEQATVDQVLAAWEAYGNRIKTFEAKFTLWTYGSVFDNGKQPTPRLGVLKYGTPDKGYFEVTGDQPEKWICDGTSLYEYNHTKKEVVQHILPPEERGKAIKNGPLPFLFGSTAAELKQRYWICTLPSDDKSTIWLRAYPKFARDAADFYCATMIVVNNANDMTPKAIQLILPNRKTTKSYAFNDVIVNDRNPLKFLQGDPFTPKVPHGWTKVVQDLSSAQATDPAAPARR